MKQDEEDDSLSEMYRAMKEASQEKRASNRENSRLLLLNEGIEFEEKNDGAHLVVKCDIGLIDFWPGTGLFKPRWKTAKPKRRGVRSLIALVRMSKVFECKEKKA